MLLRTPAVLSAITVVLAAVVLCPQSLPLLFLMKGFNTSRRWEEALSESQSFGSGPSQQPVPKDGTECW